MQKIKRSLLPVTILVGLTLGWILGKQTLMYYIFVGSEPMLFPCPYTDDPNTIACSYKRLEPPPKLAVRWHGWPHQEGVPTYPRSSGIWLIDFLFFDPGHLPDTTNVDPKRDQE